MGPPSSPTRNQTAKPILKVVYLFAEKRRHSDVAAFLKKAETEGGVQVELHEFDIERSPQHDLTDTALWDKIFDTLKEGNWVLIVSPPCNTFSRARFQNRRHPGPKPLRTRMWPRGFPWLSAAHRAKVDEANSFVDRCIHACQLVSESGGYFLLEHPEDLGTVEGEQPGSIWQWPEVLELIPCCNAVSFAIHQCHFGAPTPKPTRFMTNIEVSDKRCHIALPKFDRFGFYKGPLPKQCGHHHTQTLIGKTNSTWNTAPSAAYPPGLCQFIADLILYACASSGRGGWVKSTGTKRAEKTENTAEHSPNKKAKVSHAEQVQVISSDSDEERGSAPGAFQTSTTGAGKEPMDATTVTTTGASTVLEPTVEGDTEFDIGACHNTGKPISVEWDRTCKDFTDGFGLCSPCRWRPQQRGTRRSPDMVQLANNTFDCLAQCVTAEIPDLRLLAFKLVTGKLQESPFLRVP